MAERRSTVLVALVAGLAAIVAFGAFVVLQNRADGDDVPVAVAPAFIEPTGQAELLSPDRIAVEASSELESAGELTYGARNTLDGNRETAWNSDAADPVGQTLTYRFAEPVELTALRLVNGYAKSDEIYAANHRLKSVMVITDEASRPLTLLDTDDPQEISFEFGLTSKVIIEVTEIFEGQGFDNPEISSDLALSEIAFVAVQPG